MSRILTTGKPLLSDDLREAYYIQYVKHGSNVLKPAGATCRWRWLH
ncbi:hypothetical protein [Enterobacter cloacae complex sp.6730764]